MYNIFALFCFWFDIYEIGKQSKFKLFYYTIHSVSNYLDFCDWICLLYYSFLFYTIIISKFELSVIVPVLGGLVNVIVLLAAFFIFKETLNSTKIVGVILVCIGIIFINLKK